jgi:hypothetical protein
MIAAGRPPSLSHLPPPPSPQEQDLTLARAFDSMGNARVLRNVNDRLVAFSRGPSPQETFRIYNPYERLVSADTDPWTALNVSSASSSANTPRTSARSCTEPWTSAPIPNRPTHFVLLYKPVHLC